ncbi:putative glycosyltransferase [Candidatus Promineifilum breve]|uniref:Glycosyltransferase n=1 Tax=Candidatus Promineifilum breve TaxID=1806508 RepID=A0A160T3C2_9CHLR|nr:glycosyltransferase [Candidatus Promineifilum breve]CUS04182.2 putative glycosyltransferase [Candidatus Promineifilum breve]
MRLLIVSHTPHYRRDGQPVGWGPTVRELDYLAELFDEVTHVAVAYDEPAPASALAYGAPNVRFRPVPPAGGDSLRAKAGILAAYPAYARVIGDELRRADAVHVRCPANISLLALAQLRRAKQPPYRWVKYAGNWQPEPEAGEPWFYGLQRRWLADNRHRGVVTVNGQWPGQPPYVHSFYNPCLTEDEAAEGSRAAAAKRLGRPLELLFVGALNEGKGVGRVLRVALALQKQGMACRLRLLGDGPDRPGYEAWARANGLRDVHFMGWTPRAELSTHYAAAHFILLPSRTEGWPKVLSEAMAFGVVPVAAAVSSIPQILAAAGAGVALPPDDIDGMAAAIMRYAAEPDVWSAAARAGVEAARQFTYRHYQQAVAALLAEAWGVTLPVPPRATPPAPAPSQPSGLNGHVSRNGHHSL